MPWVVAAEGTSIEGLQAKINDRELKKGTAVKWVMDFKVPGVAWNFDMWGAENAFKPFIPDGMDLVDVYEENGRGVVEMEADPAWLFAIVGFVARHWLAIIIAGIALYIVVKLIRMLVWLEELVGPEWTKVIIYGSIIGGVCLIGYVALKKFLPGGG